MLEKRLDRINNMSQDSKIVLGTIGAVDVRYKAQEDVIRMMSELSKRGYNRFEYHLVGGGDTRYLKFLQKNMVLLITSSF